MASNTENLDLLMKNPSTDGADTFNIQTMLNENWQKIDNNAGTVAQTLANILKPTTPPIIGLPPSATPNDMFNALAHAGDLHVWRKTVTTAQEIPAGYKLESAKETLISTRAEYGSGTQRIIVEYASSCSVSESGDPYLVNSSSAILEATSSTAITSLNNLKGKFLKFSKDSSYQYVTVADGIFFIPSDATFRLESGPYRIFADKAQKITGYPLTPAGTTVTYPVSTNRNAYQEGSDAKEAGYTLGDVKTGSFAITSKSSPGGVGTYWNDSAALSVSDDGTCTLATTGGTYIDGTTTNAATTAKNELQGKFAYCNNTDTDFASSVIVFFPSNTIFTRVGNIVYADRYQPVTGYAAIPANTTIEYLGCLGDKARVQVVSYVGTGTYGEDNKNSLTFNFSPKVLLIIMSGDYNNRTYTGTLYPFSERGGCFIIGNSGWTSTLNCSESKHEIFWWSFNSTHEQLNISGYKYTAIAIG